MKRLVDDLFTRAGTASRALFFTVAMCGWTVSSCFTQDTATQVMVMVTVDGALAAQVDVVHFEVLGTEGSANDILIEDGRDLSASGAPVQISLLPANGDATLRYELVVRLEEEQEDERRIIGEQTISGGYVTNQYREVWMHFDDACLYERCPDGYRCQEGQCVEYCVEPTPEGDVTLSGPVPCGNPCESSGCCENSDCFDTRDIVVCDEESGVRVLERRCGFACEADGSCRDIVPSNLPEWEFAEGLEELVVGPEGAVIAGNFGGLISVGEEIVCPTGCEEDFVDCEPCSGPVDGIDFQVVEGGAGCNGGEVAYAVFSIGGLRVLPGSTLSITGTSPVILIVDGDVVVEGTINASAANAAGGPGGCGGSSGLGSGADADDDAGAGGGGASYGGLGGEGGQLELDEGGGAAPGSIDMNNEALTPLRGGSGGGAGSRPDGGPPGGGGGGGALQISTNGLFRIGSNAVIVSAGAGGLATETFGGGGGSGGALLLEAGELLCDAPQQGRARIGAPGGGGGSGNLNGTFLVNSGATGDPAHVPAAGGEPSGGAGSDTDGDAFPGRSANVIFGVVAGGGGGGAGIVRINTSDPENMAATYEAECGPKLEPMSFGLVEQ